MKRVLAGLLVFVAVLASPGDTSALVTRVPDVPRFIQIHEDETDGFWQLRDPRPSEGKFFTGPRWHLQTMDETEPVPIVNFMYKRGTRHVQTIIWIEDGKWKEAWWVWKRNKVLVASGGDPLP